MGKFFRGFTFAWQGIAYAFKTQINFRFHVLAMTIVIGTGLLLQINTSDWIVLCLLIGLVLSAELFNTAIEKLTDLVTTEMHPLAKIAKDTAAGAVFVLAIASVIIGILIFLPYFKALFA